MSNSTAADALSEDLIRRHEREWNEAILQRDIAAMGRFLGDSFTLMVGIEGQALLVVPKAQWLETPPVYEPRSTLMRCRDAEMRIGVHGDTAIAALAYRQ